ncbi:uncharacterized protein LOC143446516 isoform X1 [Clavelina lepadiformis]|uniref:uncharacterized protein LOC143446516 isoform X1 n=1 Tax=Clavelina lepadiformis TaxID=159417 RepID=UPI00404295F0
MSQRSKGLGEDKKDLPVVLQINRIKSAGAEQVLNSSKPPSQHTPSIVLLTKSSSKSEDSLDSGVYTRQKSCESMDSLDSNESGFNGEGSTANFPGGLSPSDEVIPPLPTQQYEDYLREVQDIRQSIIVKNQEEEKQPVSRTDSGDDQEDDDREADWLRLAGLSDLVMTSASTMMTSPSGRSVPSHVTNESLSSMTVLSTLTRPQREAVLRRITSFNRAQKSKRRPKPAITAVFPDAAVDVKPPTDNSTKPKKPDELALKSTSLPRDGGYTDGGYPRRYSETPQTTHKDAAPSSPVTPGSPGNNQVKLDYLSKHKRNVASIVATNPTEAGAQISTPTTKSLNETDNSGANLSDKNALSKNEINDALMSAPTTTAISVSMPDLNAIDDCRKDKSYDIDCCTSSQSLASSLNSGIIRTHSIASDRHKKALSDIPASRDDQACVSNNSPARLLLTDGKADKMEVAISTLSPSETGNTCKIVLSPSTKSDKDDTPVLNAPPSPIIQVEESSHNARTGKPPAKSRSSSSPEIKNHFRLSPNFSISMRRSSPFKSRHLSNPSPPSPTSPNKVKQNVKRSPLHKLSSSFSSLRSSPVRTGSYRVKQTSNSRRRSLRRVRSLRSQKSQPVNLVSVKKSLDDSQGNYSSKKASSVETLSISAHSVDRSSWKESKDEISMQFTDVANRPQDKTMSYTETANQESLPNFSLVKDRLGITKISDLSPIDMRKVQSLALIELTALFDLRGIDLKRRKLGKMKPKDSGVFGIPLTTLVECDRKRTNNPNICVPLVLSQIISFLETNALRDEGILRKSGSAARTKMLRQEIEVQFGINNLHQDAANQSGSASWPDAYPNDVAAILKEFLRGLPDPLLTTEYIEAFQSCGLITDRKEQLQALNLLIILLNQVHRNSLKLLLKFLGQVVAAERMNKMSLNNVAMIIAPNLFLNKKSSKKESSNTSQDLKHAAGTSNIVRMLIKYHKLLWTVPAFMLTQVRHMNRAEISSKKHGNPSKDKYKGFFKAKAKDPGKKLTITQASQPFDYETPKGLIRVQAPNMKLTSMAVQLDIKLTASDVIAKFQRQCERMRETGSSVEAEEVTNATHALYEVGGNIHERCLDPDTNVSALIRVNPEVTWFIRPRIDR